MTRSRAWWLGFFGALTFYWGAATFQGFDWVREFRLLRHAAQAEGVVTWLEPGDRHTPHYEFHANGKRYVGTGTSGAVGQTVTVFYLPDDPTFSTTKAPGADLGFLIFAPLVLSTVAAFSARAQVGRKARADSSGQGHRV